MTMKNRVEKLESRTGKQKTVVAIIEEAWRDQPKRIKVNGETLTEKEYAAMRETLPSNIEFYEVVISENKPPQSEAKNQ
jgi:uncharacterized coiled-coil protein SlyX